MPRPYLDVKPSFTSMRYLASRLEAAAMHFWDTAETLRKF